MSKKHIGNNFNDFLAPKALLEEATALAVKRVLFAGNEGAKADQDGAGFKDAHQPGSTESAIGCQRYQPDLDHAG